MRTLVEVLDRRDPSDGVDDGKSKVREGRGGSCTTLTKKKETF